MPNEASQPTTPSGAIHFKEGKRRLFVQAIPLDEYLNDASLGWVVRMRALLDEVDFTPFYAKYQGTGRRPYHPRVVMGLILYGIVEDKWSLRELERLSARDVGAWYICCGLRIDHSTIARFLERHDDIIQEFFNALTKTVIAKLGLKPGETVIDGTVVEAASSKLSALRIEALERASERAKEEAAGKPEDGHEAHRAEQLAEAVKVCKQRNEEREAKNRLGSGAQVVPEEPEAVVQKLKNGATAPSYKPSVIVHESGVILGSHLHPTSETAAVEPLIEQHCEIFGAPPKTTMMDAGYFTALILSFFFDKGLDLLCPSGRAFDDDSMTRNRRSERTLFLKSEFTYDEQQNAYVCPKRRLLVLDHHGSDQNGRYKKYRGTSCADCPQKAQCTKASARTIKRYDADDLKDAMVQVMRQPEAKKRFHRRSCGERPFAGIKTRQGLTRFRRRGLAGARLETTLHVAAWNLRVAVLGAASAVSVELWQRSAHHDAPWRRVAAFALLVVPPAP